MTLRQMTRLGRSISTLAATLLTVGVAVVPAMVPALGQSLVRPSGQAISIDVSKGVLISLDSNADTVFVADPTIADVQVKSPKLIYLFGKAPGETSLYAVDANQKVLLSRPVSVTRDVAQLQSALARLQPGSGVHVSAVDKSLVLTGNVASAVAADEIKTLAGSFAGDEKDVVNRVTVDRPYQVNLRVRIAEVSRTVTKELGINWETMLRSGGFAFGLATGNPVLGVSSSATSTVISNPYLPGAALTGTASSLAGTAYFTRNAGLGGTPTDSITLGGATSHLNVNSVIDALDQNGLVNILAEPNLTAMSGETASFLAGGEFPIVIPAGSLGQTTVEFKQYGVSLAFTPVVLGDGRISMRVRPEVSQLSTTGAVQISGINIPALITRRAETSVELGSGESFAIGGLLQNNLSDTINKLPGLGDLPVLGPLFRSTQFQRNESELIIIVTPYLVRPVPGRIPVPTDGYVAPHDSDIYVNGKTGRAPDNISASMSAPRATGLSAPAPQATGLIGAAGFTLN
jgi:pilus assembly protein CpaC